MHKGFPPPPPPLHPHIHVTLLLTHDFKLGTSAPLLIPYPSCHIKSLHLLQPASLRAVPDIDGQSHVQDEHISTVHGAPCKTGLVGEEGEEEEGEERKERER